MSTLKVETPPSRHRSLVPSIELGGLPIARLGAADVVAHVFESLREDRGGWLVTANVDYLRRSVADEAVAALYAEADLVVADGTPLVWASRLRGEPLPERVPGSDLVWLLAEAAAVEHRSLFLLGATGDTGERAAHILQEHYPGLPIAGWANPWISTTPTEADIRPIVEEIVDRQPSLVYVAMGSPKQEYVIRATRAELPTAWFMGCGVSLSFIAGDIRRAPVWMQRIGLEWLHRLHQEPRHLARRYVRHDVPFTLKLLRDAVGTRTGRAPGRRLGSQ